MSYDQGGELPELQRLEDGTYICDPSENIGVKANVILWDVEASLNEDFTLQRTAVV